MTRDQALAKIRALCAKLDGVTERPSHGAPAWFANKRQFAALADDHHGDGRLAFWCAAPEGAQAMLVESSPEHYFVPPYVGPSGWIGVRVDRAIAWSEVAAIVEEAHAMRMAKKVAAPKKKTASTAKKTAREKAAR